MPDTSRRGLRLAVLAVALATVLGLSLRLSWAEERAAQRRTGKGWGMRVDWEPNLARTYWFTDEYLSYTSAAVNAFRGRGLVADYNHVQDGVFVTQPGQALFVLALFHAFGDIPDARRLFQAQAAFSALLVPLLAYVAARLVSPAAGVAAAFLAAIHPSFVFWSAHLMTESNYLVGLALVLALLLRWVERPGAGRALVAAFALGLIHLQRPNALHLGPVLAGFALAWPGRRRGMPSAAILLAIPYLVPVPWLIHNLRAWGEPVYLNNTVGLNVYLANHAGLDPLATACVEEVLAKKPNGPFLSEIETRFRKVKGRLRTTYYPYSNAYGEAAFAYIREEPLHFLRNYAIKLVQQFVLLRDDTGRAVRFFAERGRYAALHWMLFAGGLAGTLALCLRPRSAERLLFLTVFLYFALTHALSISSLDGRYALNLKLFLVVSLAAGVGLAIERARGRLRLSAAPASAGGGPKSPAAPG
jgi:hypothetical protein